MCLTQDCNVERTVTPLWGINSMSGKSVNGADTTTCQTAANSIAEKAKTKSCGTSTNLLKWNVYSDASCTTSQTIWSYKATCDPSGCSDGICQR